MRVARAALLFGLACCAGDARPEDLPAGAEQVAGDALLACWGADDRPPPDLDLVEVAVRRLGVQLGREPAGWLVATAPEVGSGWPSLADAAPFREAWAGRPARAAEYWVYADLQGLVDLGLTRLLEFDRRARELAGPLGLSGLEWAIASVRIAGGLEVLGVLRSTGADVGAVAVLNGAPAPSLLGAARDGERLRVELRADPEVARRTVEAWLAEDAGGGAFSMRDALGGLLGQAWQDLTAQLDGAASLVVVEAGSVLAIGLREPDDTRDLLDRYLRRDGDEIWIGPGGRRITVGGARLLFVDGEVTVPGPGGPVIDFALMARFADGGGRDIRLEVRRQDARTLEFSARER